ncbi:OmpA family protein [Sphingomonas sp.]|uniref:OmpA family protein n=1 Tax=Sphingomonas sp. TaxID=28214 RepID=UPI003CC5AD34
MRKLAIALALASTTLATPALAHDKSWYVGVEGGGAIVENINFDITTAAGARTARAGVVNHDYGWDVGGTIGYDFGGFRVESEVSYRSASVDSYRSSLTTPYTTTSGTTANVPSGIYGYADGRTNALSFMVNGLLDFGSDDGVQGFVGGGVGVARVKGTYGLTRRGFFADDSDTVFAYQGLAGIRAPLSDHIDATLKYRFFTADSVRLIDTTNRTYDGKFRSHSIMGGVTYNFFTPPPPPPPPVTPPPPPPVDVTPPPPPPPVCSPGPFIVFFEWDKSDITPEAQSILDNAVTQYQTCGNAQVMLAGHADRSGAPAYNVGLSQRRADSVKAYLSQHGIADSVITTQAFGESRPRVDTADGVREVQNRRVEVTYGPGAGQ